MGLPLILDQMIYLKQIYTKTPNLVDNITIVNISQWTDITSFISN